MSDDARHSGGPQGVTARYTDMRRCGELLVGMSTVFTTDAATIGRYATDPDLLSSAVFAPVEAVQVEARLVRVGIDLAADAVELGVLGTFLVGAVEAYEMADQAIAAIETGAANVFAFAVGNTLPAIALVGTAKYLELAATTWAVDQARGIVDPNYDPQDFNQVLSDQNAATLAWLEDHPEIVDPLMRGAPGLVNGLTATPMGLLVFNLIDGLSGGAIDRPLTYEQTVTAILSGGAVFGLFSDGKTTVHPTNRSDDEKLNKEGNVRVERISNLNDVLTSLGEIDEYDDDDGDNKADFSRIRVVRSVGDDGVTRWIVQVPSTQSWNASAGPPPNDVTACLVEMSDQTSALNAAVGEAMQQAGVRKGDPVMLTGFSLGGITAGHMAADPTFTSAYDVQAVLTAGSPVANFDINDDIQVLSFEHYDDYVPHLDGHDNPDRPSWTTIHDTAPTVPFPYEKPDDPDDDYTSRDHNAFTYARTARDAQNTGGPNVEQYMDVVQPFLGGEQTIIDFRAEREH